MGNNTLKFTTEIPCIYQKVGTLFLNEHI